VAKRTDSATIGAFVIGALVLVVAAILVWGSGRLFRQQTVEFVCYFDDSVAGLETGAPVKARGVVIGKVVRIHLRYRQKPYDNRIPVFIELDTKRLRGLGVMPLPSWDLREPVANGLRARLESQSIITGTLYVDLAFYPGSPIVRSEIDPAAGYPELPTVRTRLAEVSKSVTVLLSNLAAIDFAGAVKSIEGAASSFDRLASGNGIPKVLEKADATLTSYQRLAEHVDAGLPSLIAQLQATTDDVRKTLVGVDGATAAAGRLVAPQAALSVRLSEGLADVDRAANAVRELADFLRRNPNALIVGKGR
jgi:paraquat-inducible protein B